MNTTPTSPTSNLQHLLKPITLEGDSSANIQQFYDSMNTAIMTTLSAHSFLPDYEDLTQDFDFTQHLIPPSTHPQYQDCSNTYKQYNRALLLHVLSPHTIPQDKAPTAFQVVQENSLQKDDFCFFFKITVALSPQLGGDYRDST